MADKDGIVLSAEERQVVIKALQLLAGSRERQLVKERPDSRIGQLISEEIGHITALCGRFR